MTKMPSDEILESLYKLRIRESDQLKTLLELYDMDIHQKNRCPIVKQLETMVKRSIDQKLRLRNFDVRNERIEKGAVVTNRRGQRGVERRPGERCQWKAKEQCSRGDQCSFWHDSDERAKSTPENGPSSEPPTQRGGRASRKRNIRGRSPSGKSNRQPCRDFLKGICTKLLRDNWHLPECQFYKSESGCTFGKSVLGSALEG